MTVACVSLGVRPLVNSIATVAYYARQKANLRPDWRLVEWTTCHRLLGAGSVYLSFLLLQALVIQSDQILVARLINIAAVTDYSIVQKILTAPSLVTDLYLMAQWPAYGGLD